MSVPKDQMNVDGIKSDGVGHDVATPEQLATFDEARAALSRFRAPVLVHTDNPHERLFIAAFDGTANDKYADPEHATNVAKIDTQIKALGDERVYANYVPGPGTQDNPLVRTWDQIRGFSYEDRLDEMYDDLVRQAWKWQKADPHVQIRVQSIGFSRGASQAAGFTRLLHERGIRDPDSRITRINEHGEIVREYTRHIMPPGKTLQAVGLFDPVATGEPMNYDRRLPPSVVSGFQLTAADEQRATFPSDHILPPGLSEDGRFLNLMVPGAHADVGGGYYRDGLATRSCNLMIDYCNSAYEEPLLHKYRAPNDPRLNVIHRSWEGMLPYRLDPREAIRGEPSGTNVQLAPPHVTEAGPLPHRPEPLDVTLAPSHAPRALRIIPEPPTFTTPPPIAEALAVEAGRVSLASRMTGIAGTATLAYDAIHTTAQATDAFRQGNPVGGESTVMHFGGRNVGMLGGAVLGTETGAALGIESGPGALLTSLIGGAVGAVAGNKIADAIDHSRIYQQTDQQGLRWHYDPAQPAQGWTRSVIDHGHSGVVNAPPALAKQLSYQASSTAVQLALAYAPAPQNPYEQPAEPNDTPSRRDSPWTRDTDTHVWTRTVVTGVIEHGMVNAHTEYANAQRAATLERAAEAVVAQNVANSPAAIAARYQADYEQYGWREFGPPADAVVTALRTPATSIQASDGHRYAREADGQWTTPGRLYGTNPASGTIKDELAATYQREQAMAAQSAQQHADEAARAAQQVRLQQQIAHQHRVAAEEKDAAQRATEERIIQQRAAEPAPIPDHLRDFRHASHPLHGTYADVLDAVHAMEDDRQIPHGPESEKLAATLTYRIATTRFEDGPAHASPLFHALDRVELRDRDTIVAIEPRVNYALAPKEVSVSINHALSQSVPQTSETWARQTMPHLFEPAPTHARAPAVDVARLPDYDLRHPDHPQHRAYQTLRERVAQVYARDGVPVSDDHLERATAALAVERQRLEIGEPSTLRLIHQPHTGNTGAQSLLVMSESLPNGYSLEAEVTAKAMQVPPEQSYQQLAQVIQQQSVEQQQLLQQAHGAARTL